MGLRGLARPTNNIPPLTTDAASRFEMQMPVGPGSMSASGIGYRGRPFAGVEVPAGGRDDIVLEAPRQPGLLVHFVTTAPDAFEGTFINAFAQGEQANAGGGLRGEWWFHLQRQGNQSVTISLVRHRGEERRELLPPTVYEYATAPWPVEIPLD